MKELDYKTVRSRKRKHLTITVERDSAVVVRAPEGMTDAEVRDCVEAKRQWIVEKLRSPQKYQERRHPPGKELVNGEAALFLGRDYRIWISETVTGEVEFANRFLVPPDRRTKRRDVLRSWYIAQAKKIILERAAQHARAMGVKYTRAQIVNTRYSWGSCSPKDHLAFNWRLIKAPMFVIDYVVIHELAHLIEGNHTSAFWSVIRAQTPTMHRARSWLREHGQLLEEEI
jgi:hypothetical protein